MRKLFSIAAALLLITTASFFSPKAQGQPFRQTDPAILKDFMRQRFGIFIHWGPVTLRGTEIGWSRNHQVAQADYDSLYREFNPVLFDADAWVKAVKDAGARYLTITAKHHDGFCLWPSRYTPYNIANTPYKKDIVGALAKACARQGIKFCIYYTVLDWYHPDYPLHNDGRKVPDSTADMSRFVQYMKHQLQELITQYHPYMLWFDGNWEEPWTVEMGRDVYQYIKRLDPNVIVNNRLGKGKHKQLDSLNVGDYATPEQEIGQLNMQDPWESCITICKQWSWKPNDELKPLHQCLQTLSQTAGGNGNLLLNISPMPDGRIEWRQTQRLQQMGHWMQQNGRAIYGTLGGPYLPDSNYVSTRKGNKIFVHILNTKLQQLELPAVPGARLLKASFPNGTQLVSSQPHGNLFRFSWSEALPDAGVVILELELDRNVEDIAIIQHQ